MPKDLCEVCYGAGYLSECGGNCGEVTSASDLCPMGCDSGDNPCLECEGTGLKQYPTEDWRVDR